MVASAQSGLSLVETEFAMLLLAVGLLATFTLAVRSRSLMRSADAGEGAAQVAGEVIDSLAQHGSPGSGAVVRGRYALSWNAARDSLGVSLLMLVVRYHDGSRMRADTLGARVAPWPRSILHVP